jgi:hypothetical protein
VVHTVPYLQHEKRRFPILHASKIQELAIGFSTTLIADIHALEDGCVEHNAMYMLSPHDYARLSLQLWCFLVRTFLELEANIDLQIADASLFPFFILEMV